MEVRLIKDWGMGLEGEEMGFDMWGRDGKKLKRNENLVRPKLIFKRNMNTIRLNFFQRNGNLFR